MSNFDKPRKPARFINPPNLLKQKVGGGGLPKEILEQSQNVIENTTLNFKPYAEGYLKQFSSASDIVMKEPERFRELKDTLINPMMQLKANGGMFRYDLLSDVADIALYFLETIQDLNNDAGEVLVAHQNTLYAIISNELKGHGGSAGDALIKELERVCARYFKKHPIEE